MYDKLFRKTTLYIVRTDNNGNYQNSAPCINCFNIIRELNVKKIIFSTEDDFACFKTSEYHTTHISHGNRYLHTLKSPSTKPPSTKPPSTKPSSTKPHSTKPPSTIKSH